MIFTRTHIKDFFAKIFFSIKPLYLSLFKQHHKTITMIQLEAVESGAACLGMVLSYYKKYVTLDELRSVCGVTPDGTKASHILKAAHDYGLIGKGFKKEPTELYTMQRPFIVLWNINHYVVVEGFNKNQVYINDPAYGPRVISKTKFTQYYNGVVLTFKPGDAFKPGGKKPSTINTVKKRFNEMHTHNKSKSDQPTLKEPVSKPLFDIFSSISALNLSQLKPWRHKTMTVMQLEAAECGAACLGMVLTYYKKYIALEELRLVCGVTRDGSKASNILKAARSYDLIAKGFKKEPEDLYAMQLPLIVFWNFNHYVVVEGFYKEQVYINDPAYGSRIVSNAEFDQSFTGVVLTFEPGDDFTPGGEKPSAIRALKKRFKGLHTSLIFLFLVGLMLVIPGLVIPVYTGIFVDKILVGNMESWLRPLLIGMIITALLRVGLTWLQSYYLLRVQTKIALIESSKYFWHVLRLPIEFFTQRSAGDIGTRLNINERVASILTGELAQAALSAFTIVFFAALMFSYDVMLTLISITVVALNLMILKIIATRSRETSQRLAIVGGRLIGVTMNGLSVMETVKSTGGESSFFSKWAGFQAKYINAQQDVARIDLVMGVIPTFLTSFNSVIVLIIGGFRVMDGHLTLGQLVAYQSLVTSFVAPASILVGLANQLQQVKGDMDRLDDVMKYPLDTKVIETDQQAIKKPKLHGYLALKDVSFGYNQAGFPLIENFSLTLNPGDRIAIVGPSGCGKSTISKLIMGLYGPWSGELLFDGKPREAYSRYEFSNSVAMVDQDISFFEGTIRENLTMWDHGISDKDLMRATKDACIHDFIISRRGGYDSRVEEGATNMSGGQRQRLEIARALVVNPRLLILDEATSALDAATEQAIDINLRRRACATIIIAHRLSTVRDADEIIMLSYGHIIERGSHDELIKNTEGHYYKLAKLL